MANTREKARRFVQTVISNGRIGVLDRKGEDNPLRRPEAQSDGIKGLSDLIVPATMVEGKEAIPAGKLTQFITEFLVVQSELNILLPYLDDARTAARKLYDIFIQYLKADIHPENAVAELEGFLTYLLSQYKKIHQMPGELKESVLLSTLAKEDKSIAMLPDMIVEHKLRLAMKYLDDASRRGLRDFKNESKELSEQIETHHKLIITVANILNEYKTDPKKMDKNKEALLILCQSLKMSSEENLITLDQRNQLLLEGLQEAYERTPKTTQTINLSLFESRSLNSILEQAINTETVQKLQEKYKYQPELETSETSRHVITR